MYYGSGSTRPVWLDGAPLTTRPPANVDLTADVCVVGAGVAGLTVAYMLAREGKDVVVIDDGPVGGGETCRTTAHLSNAIDDRFSYVIRCRGKDMARLAAESHAAAIDTIEQIVEREGIDCHFHRTDGYLVLAEEHDSDLLDEELDACRSIGLDGVDRLDNTPLDTWQRPCLRFPRQAHIHPGRYISGLAEALERAGGKIFGSMHGRAIQGGEDAVVHTTQGPEIRCRAIVVATNSPINDFYKIHTKQYPYRTYAIAMEVQGEPPSALFWDTLEPYHYVRHSHEGGGLLIIGGEDHKTGQANDGDARYHQLEKWAQHRFPFVGRTVARWSGQVMETMDGLGFIGRNPGDDENVFIATGDSGMGMTHGTIAGMLIHDLVLERPNGWDELYDPSRKPVKAAQGFIKGNANVAAQYADWLKPSQADSEKELMPDGGAVMRDGTGRVACHRDQQGQVHRHSAKCPHMGCVVQYNSTERTWDCPCHGSRFTTDGDVVNGPANASLSPAKQEQKEDDKDQQRRKSA
jgi:glycine/D-amino acid oxidase-like deaminating enzyme/nitrite reductase/ring-hydroxylating ferredoxin subunit